MDLATATNNLQVTNNTSNHNYHHNHHHQQRGLSEGQFEKHESAIETNVKPLTFTNGVLKRHGNVATVTGSNAAAATRQLIDVANSTIYKECLKNHAASLGGHALDGCGEFMPSPNSSPAHPTSLKCAACGCHRNFHRRDPDDPCPLVIQPPTTITQVIEYQPHHRHHPPAPVTTSPSPASFRQHSPSPPSPPPISSSYYPSSAPHMLLALSSGGVQNPPPVTTTPPVQNPAENSQNVSVFATPVSNNTTQMTTATANGRKRFRTKFTSGQKEKMLDFAERVGWKMQKRDDEIVASFCKEIGVERGVLKVWMHNNKSKSGESHQIDNQQLRQQQHQQQHVNNVVATNGNLVRNNVVDINALNMNHSVMHNSNHHNGGVGSGHHVRGNNHDDGDDEDDSEDDDDDSPHHGALGSSSTS